MLLCCELIDRNEPYCSNLILIAHHDVIMASRRKSGFKMQQHHYSHQNLIKYPSLYTYTCVPRISSMFWPVAVLIDNGIGARITMVEAMFVMSDTCLINSINSYVTWRQIGHHSPWKCFAPCRFHATFRRSNGQQGGYKYYATKLHRILS